MHIHNSDSFFIVGSGRSGSTLLRLILSSHSRIAIPPETWYVLPLIKKTPMTSTLSITEVEQALDIITSHYRWPDMGIEKKDLYTWASNLLEPRLRDILDLIYSFHLKLENKERWGDKTPPYIMILPELLLLYPDTKFINIVRDGHDVCKSFQNKGWNGKWLFRNISEWKEAIIQYNFYKETNLADRIFEVKYEDLVIDTEATVKKICSFLEESFEPGMLNWETHAKEKIPDRELHIHEKIFRRPQKSDTLRWRRECSLREIFLIESYISKELKSLDYEVKFNGMVWIPLFFLVRSCCSIFFLSYSLSKKIFSGFKSILKFKKYG